jgi:uncharacterized membrane protein YphA (DoxX/SURF4 family)
MEKKFKLLRYSIASLFILFGVLKFFPQLSPAETIGIDTVSMLTCHILPDSLCIFSLALFEITIGLLLISGKFPKFSISIAIAHLLCTFTPFIFFPESVFNLDVNSLSLLGQYIIKNIVIISALLIIYPQEKFNKLVAVSDEL